MIVIYILKVVNKKKPSNPCYETSSGDHYNETLNKKTEICDTIRVLQKLALCKMATFQNDCVTKSLIPAKVLLTRRSALNKTPILTPKHWPVYAEVQ